MQISSNMGPSSIHWPTIHNGTYWWKFYNHRNDVRLYNNGELQWFFSVRDFGKYSFVCTKQLFWKDTHMWVYMMTWETNSRGNSSRVFSPFFSCLKNISTHTINSPFVRYHQLFFYSFWFCFFLSLYMFVCICMKYMNTRRINLARIAKNHSSEWLVVPLSIDIRLFFSLSLSKGYALGGIIMKSRNIFHFNEY